MALTNSAHVTHEQLRDRVRLYLKVMFLIDVGFLAAGGIVAALVEDTTHENEFPAYVAVLRFSMTVVLGVAWAYCARRVPSRKLLICIETLGTFLLTIVYVQLASTLPEYAPAFAVLLVVLPLVLRASLVPSPAIRTLLVGSASIAATLAMATQLDHGPPMHVIMFLTIAGFGLVVTTVVTSHVVYGLRRQIHAAKMLGQYQLQEKIGEGGMGVVYRATHVMLRRPTAVKLLPLEKAGEQTVARFEREVQQTSRLEHPNSVFIYDYGRTPDGQFYYAMEFLDGVNLDELVRLEGPIESARVRFILQQAARALAEAHDMGLVHRDIKPANIMLCDRGMVPDTVKVLDFGLVKAITGAASDVYGLAAVGYFLITGRDVFQGATIIEVCAKHLSDEPELPSSIVDGHVDPALEALLLQCLAKNPDDRPKDGAAFAEKLESLPGLEWPVASARAWWQHYADDLSKRAHKGEVISSPTQLAVDLAGRAVDEASFSNG